LRSIKLCFLLLLVCRPLFAGGAMLPQRIESILKRYHLADANVSIKILNLVTGEILFEKDADRPLNPASIVKLVTLGAAFHSLGPDYTFKTEFYSEAMPREGRLGDLWIKGYGDPLLVSEEIQRLVEEIRREGWREIAGSVFVDDSYFEPGRQVIYHSEGNGHLYHVLNSPLSLNFNTLEIVARPNQQGHGPAFVETRPPTRYVTLLNQTRTTGGRASSLDVSSSPGGGGLVVTGNIPSRLREVSVRKEVGEPAIYAGTAILEALEQAGFVARSSVSRGNVPPGRMLIFTHDSKPLSEIVIGLGKRSNNFIAEQIFLALGARRGGAPGNEIKGREALAEYLSFLGIPGDSYVIDNGSGLSKSTRLSANQVIRVLQDIHQQPWAEKAISSLSVGGIDGTLKKRFRGRLRGKVFAKTGSLFGVRALAGYIKDGGDPVAFAMIFNGFSRNHVAQAEEKILEAVTR